MLREAEPNSEAVTRLKNLKVSSPVFQPLKNRPAKEDFIGIMQANLKNL